MLQIHFRQQLAESKDELLAMAALSPQAMEFAVESLPPAQRRALPLRPRSRRPPPAPNSLVSPVEKDHLESE